MNENLLSKMSLSVNPICCKNIHKLSYGLSKEIEILKRLIGSPYVPEWQVNETKRKV